MSDCPSVNQTNNKVSGSIVARDHIINNLPEKKTSLRRLAETFQRIDRTDSDKTEFIEELQNYMMQMPNSPRDLREKLLQAGRASDVDEAECLKERFVKKLHREAFSPLAQQIFVHILADIHSRFNMTVKPQIKEGIPITEIDRVVYDQIINYIYNEVGDSELSITTADIRGMLYYIAGKCYIDWDNT